MIMIALFMATMVAVALSFGLAVSVVVLLITGQDHIGSICAWSVVAGLGTSSLLATTHWLINRKGE